MGLPAYRLPESRAFVLEKVLVSENITVRSENETSQFAGDAQKVVGLYFCSASSGAAVRLRIQSVLDPSSGHMTRIAVLEPASATWFHLLKERRLMKRVGQVLMDHGASEFP